MDPSLILSQLPMWLTFAVILAALIFYATEWASIELVSMGSIVALMILASLIPSADFAPADLLLGFANPALMTIWPCWSSARVWCRPNPWRT